MWVGLYFLHKAEANVHHVEIKVFVSRQKCSEASPRKICEQYGTAERFFCFFCFLLLQSLYECSIFSHLSTHLGLIFCLLPAGRHIISALCISSLVYKAVDVEYQLAVLLNKTQACLFLYIKLQFLIYLNIPLQSFT